MSCAQAMHSLHQNQRLPAPEVPREYGAGCLGQFEICSNLAQICADLAPGNSQIAPAAGGDFAPSGPWARPWPSPRPKPSPAFVLISLHAPSGRWDRPLPRSALGVLCQRLHSLSCWARTTQLMQLFSRVLSPRQILRARIGA